MLTFRTKIAVKHTNMCQDCEASSYGLRMTKADDGSWVAFFAHDIGEGGADFQPVLIADTKDEILHTLELEGVHL